MRPSTLMMEMGMGNGKWEIFPVRRFQTDERNAYEKSATVFGKEGESMVAAPVISRERVAAVADDMFAKGDNPTVASVVAVTGGRRDYVRQLLKEWWKQRSTLRTRH